MWLSALPIVAVVAAQGPPQGPGPGEEPFKGVTTNGTVVPGLFPIRVVGCVDGAGARGGDGVSRHADARAARQDGVRRRRRRMAQVEQRPSLHPPGRQLQGDERAAAERRRSRCCKAGLSAKGSRDVAQHHAAQRDHRRDDEAVRRVRRRPLQRHGHGRAVGDVALGLAARRPSPDHQLLRPARPGGDDADVHGIRADSRRGGQVRRHRGASGRAGQGPRVHAGADARAAEESDAAAGEDREQCARPRRSATTWSSTMPA